MAASKYLTLGRGELWFAPFTSEQSHDGAFEFLGNCPAFNITATYEELTHMDSTKGLKEEDYNEIVSRSVTGTITCDDLKPENLARFFFGSQASKATTSLSSQTEEFDGVKQGRMYQIGVTDLAPTGLKALTGVTVDDGEATPTVYTLNTDYTVDTARGQVTIVEGGAIADGSDIRVNYGVGVSTRNQVISANLTAQGELKFVSRNSVGRNVDYTIPWCQLLPSSEISLISDDWVTLDFDMKCLKLPSKAILYMEDQVVLA